MPYHKPLNKKGKREPPYWHFIKLCWFMVHFDDIFDEISIRKFCINFFELVISKGIIEKIESEFDLEWIWFDEDGIPEKPDYDKLMSPKSKPKYYEWYSQYPTFKTDRLQLIENTEREKFIRNIPNIAKGCYTTIKHCESRETWFDEMERKTGKPFDYPRNKNPDTQKNEVEIWKDIVNITNEDETSEDVQSGIIPIEHNPPWLDEKQLKARNDYVWDMLPKRD